MTRTTCAVVDTGVDYLTLTTAPGEASNELLQYAHESAVAMFDDGMWEWKGWGANGYRGEKIGSLGYGSSEQGAIVQCSGAAAQVLAKRLALLGVRARCTRIDLQVTGRFNRDCSRYDARAATQIREAQAATTQGRPSNLEGHLGYGRGNTLTCGSRSSERCFRIYDKTREQRGAVESNLWRWEVEYKRELARKAWELMRRAMMHPTASEGIVVYELERKGVVIPWEKGEAIAVTNGHVPPSDVLRKLRWIEKQVLPTIAWLRQQGYGDTVEALLAPKVPNSNEAK